MYYIDCFFYSFVIDNNTLNKFRIHNNIKDKVIAENNIIEDKVIKKNNNKINYLQNINYIKAKKINKNIKSFKSISKNLNKLVI